MGCAGATHGGRTGPARKFGTLRRFGTASGGGQGSGKSSVLGKCTASGEGCGYHDCQTIYYLGKIPILTHIFQVG